MAVVAAAEQVGCRSSTGSALVFVPMKATQYV